MFAEERILEGKVLQFGRMIHVGDEFVQVLSNDLSSELSRLQNQTVRMLCEMKGPNCEPVRYDIYPFADSKGIDPWTLKKIPDYVNRGLFAFNPTVSPDGRSLFWTVFVRKGRSGTQKIWIAEKDRNGFWKDGREMDPPLNNDLPSALISALPGGNELFLFGSFGINDSKQVPLYKSYKENNSWSNPKMIDFPRFYNLYRKKESPSQEVFGGCTLSSSGTILIYSAQHEDSRGKLDLYVSVQNESGTYLLGENLGDTINTEKEEMAPFLASDSRTLYYSSDGKNGLSIYVTKRIGEGWKNWTPPVEVSKNLRDVNFFSIPANGEWAYASKEGHLFMTYLPKEFRPNPVVVINGKVLDEEGSPLSAEIHYESLTRLEKRGSSKSDPKTGEFSLILPYGEKYGFYAEKEGYLPVSLNVDLSGTEKTQEKIQVEFRLPTVSIGRQIQLNNLFFESNKYELSKDSEPELDRIGALLKSKPNLKILVEGHTDNIGKKSDNQTLSENRAKAVLEYLKAKHKIEETRIMTKGFGDSVPITENDSPEGRQKNRRVVLKISE
ncbi:OmpA family protein [Leptospira perolatii]|nr:OmpA family protein [Leptospira perolatii]